MTRPRNTHTQIARRPCLVVLLVARSRDPPTWSLTRYHNHPHPIEQPLLWYRFQQNQNSLKRHHLISKKEKEKEKENKNRKQTFGHVSPRAVTRLVSIPLEKNGTKSYPHSRLTNKIPKTSVFNSRSSTRSILLFLKVLNKREGKRPSLHPDWADLKLRDIRQWRQPNQQTLYSNTSRDWISQDVLDDIWRVWVF